MTKANHLTLRIANILGIFLLISPVLSAQNYGCRTEAMPDSLWKHSIWISAADAPVVNAIVTDRNFKAADGASCFVSELTNDGRVVSARWMTTGLGVYDIYVNGKLIGKEVLKPGFTHNAKTKYSFTYDVTDVFRTRPGALNQLSAQVTPGWWGDRIVTPAGHFGMIGKKCAFRSVLELTYADGSISYHGTNLSDWKAGVAGPITHAAIFDGEYYDARILPGYLTYEKLKTPEYNSEFQGEILAASGAEVYRRDDLALDPKSAYVWKEVENSSKEEYGKVLVSREYGKGQTIRLFPGENLVIDFGQNAAAVPSFVFKAEEGTVMTCLPGELLNDGNGARSRGMDGPEGSVHRQNLRIPEEGMILSYTFSDDGGFVDYSPRSTFFGYRYISITASDTLHISSVQSVPVSSVSAELETGSIVTGDESVNKLISNTLWGMISNYLSVPTDCPQRNERLGWTADTQVFAETGSFFADTESFLRKWMRDMRDTQSDKGGFPGVAPLAQYGAERNSMMRLGWADAGVIVPWTIWKQFGNTEIIDENWDAMLRFIEHVNETKYDHRALSAENGNYQWADWLSYEPLESNGGGAFSIDFLGIRAPKAEAVEYWNYLGASYWAIDAAMMRDMAEATGRDASPFELMLNEAREYLRINFLNEDGSFRTDVFNTMQTPALFALKNNLLEEEAKANMIERLRENFAEHDGCLQTGFLGTSILMSTLTDNGMTDIAYELLFQRKNPSWLYSIDNGATTIWERWNSYTIESGMGPKGMNSFNHYAYGCVCEWIWETVAGIASDPAQPGFRHIIMKPVPDRRLGFIDAEYNSAAGCIKSAWRYEGEDWIWEFTIPEGCTASVCLPDESEYVEYSAGTYTLTKNL